MQDGPVALGTLIMSLCSGSTPSCIIPIVPNASLGAGFYPEGRGCNSCRWDFAVQTSSQQRYDVTILRALPKEEM